MMWTSRGPFRRMSVFAGCCFSSSPGRYLLWDRSRNGPDGSHDDNGPHMMNKERHTTSLGRDQHDSTAQHRRREDSTKGTGTRTILHTAQHSMFRWSTRKREGRAHRGHEDHPHDDDRVREGETRHAVLRRTDKGKHRHRQACAGRRTSLARSKTASGTNHSNHTHQPDDHSTTQQDRTRDS